MAGAKIMYFACIVFVRFPMRLYVKNNRNSSAAVSEPQRARRSMAKTEFAKKRLFDSLSPKETMLGKFMRSKKPNVPFEPSTTSPYEKRAKVASNHRTEKKPIFKSVDTHTGVEKQVGRPLWRVSLNTGLDQFATFSSKLAAVNFAVSMSSMSFKELKEPEEPEEPIDAGVPVMPEFGTNYESPELDKFLIEEFADYTSEQLMAELENAMTQIDSDNEHFLKCEDETIEDLYNDDYPDKSKFETLINRYKRAKISGIVYCKKDCGALFAYEKMSWKTKKLHTFSFV